MKKTINFLLVLPIAVIILCLGITASAAQINGNTQEVAEGQLMSFDRYDFSNDLNVIGAVTSSTYNSLVSKLNSYATTARQRINQLYDIDKVAIESYISEANSSLSRMNQILSQIGSASGSTKDSLTTEFNTLEAKVEYLCSLILTSSAESRVVSARSTWHRPAETTYQKMKETVETFKNSGINLIFLETFYHGCAAFKTSFADIPYHPTLANSYTDPETGKVYGDYLSAFIHLCGEYGIEVHAWVENFYVGVNAGAQILQNHPDWIMYNDDGSITQRKEGGAYIFIDPANPEVQNLLIDFYNEIFEKFPEVKGLNLDYIRYPVSSKSQDTGFGVGAMKDFYKQIGKEFTEAQLADTQKMLNAFLKLFNSNYLPGGQTEANSNYNKWVEYRTDVITEFVRRIKNEVKEPKDIILSTAVFASLSESLDSKKADWQLWFNNGWIDIATPMAYYTSASTVGTRVKEMIKVGGSDCLYYTGIASSYSGLPAWQNKEFLEASYNAGAVGYVIFSGVQILDNEDVQLALSSGVNSKWGVLPHADISDILTATFADIISKAERLYIPAAGMTASKLDSLRSYFDQLLQMNTDTVYGVYSVRLKVVELIGNLSSYASGYSLQRMKEQLNILSGILDTRISIQLVREGRWDPEITPTRPEITENMPVIPGKQHSCESLCPECGKCLDSECAEDACVSKCEGHQPVVEAHACESVCAECGKCLDLSCTESVCSDKCEGHQPVVPDEPKDDPVTPDKPDTPENSENPDESDKEDIEENEKTEENESDTEKGTDTEEPRPGFFGRIWRAIVSFFRRLFGIKK